MSNDLLTLIEQYWNLAYAEGKEGRTHDTETGDAQRVLHQIKDAIAALEAAKLEKKSVQQTDQKMVTPYITQEQFDKTFPADPTAKVELQIVAWAHPDGDIIGDYQKEYNTYQFSKEYLAQHNIPLMFHPDSQAAIAAQGEKK